MQVNFFTATLAQSLSDNGSETEVFVNSIQTLDGETISTSNFSVLGKGYLTIDPQSSQRVERISFATINPTDISFTSCVRGLLNIGGAGSSTDNAHYHPVGSPVIISFGADDITDLVTYMNSLALAGAPNASTTVKGIVQQATQAQVDAGTAAGSTGAQLFVGPATVRSGLVNDYVADTGTANAYVITPLPAITAYAVGQIFSFLAAHTNTTASTLNVNALGAKNIFRNQNGTTAACTGNEILASALVVVEYDGTQFQIISSLPNTLSTSAGVIYYAAGGGSANTYTASPSPALLAYTAGITINVTIANTSTGTSTLNVSGLGAKTITKLNGTTNITKGDLVSGSTYQFVYDGTNFAVEVPTQTLNGISTITASSSAIVTTTITSNFKPRTIQFFWTYLSAGSGTPALSGSASYNNGAYSESFIENIGSNGGTNSYALVADTTAVISGASTTTGPISWTSTIGNLTDTGFDIVTTQLVTGSVSIKLSWIASS